MRVLSPEERSLLLYLMAKASLPSPDAEWLNQLKIEAIGPGRSSFRILRDADRDYGQLASDVDFLDEDNVHVLASLFIDRRQIPYEVEIWKVDDTRLIRLPMFPVYKAPPSSS
jgi:hypothetical protein